MKALILSVDYAPPDLDEQLPVAVDLVRELPGPDRSDYWLGRLDRPLRYAKDGSTRQIRWVILASRYVGQSIRAGVGRITVGIAFVLDDAQAELPTVDMRKCRYAAIGEAEIA
ncbi:MAG TPA: hypothetical protein VF041_02525 [Gemmatimonadaceae bacterium]